MTGTERPDPVPLQIHAFRIILLALLYIITGKVGLELAVPPGYATMIWPPSGIALGALLIYGWRLWPGIFIGSFILNAHIGGAFSGEQHLIEMGKLLPAAIIAVGSSLQAVISWNLANRAFTFPIDVARPGHVLILFLLCGPLACITAATIGTGTLYGTGIVATTDLVHNWLAWWTGDIFGIIVFTPLVLLYPLGRKSQVTWRGSTSLTMPFLTVLSIILPLGLTFYAWKVTSEDAYTQTTTEFRALVQDSQNAIIHRLESYSHSLGSGVAYYRNIKDLDREKWNNFASALPLKESYPGINGIGVIYNVPHKDLDQFTKQAREEYGKDFAIHPDTSTDTPNYIIKYIYPETVNKEAIGLNIGFEKNRRDAADESSAFGRPVITRKITLVQDSEKSPGFLFLYPITSQETQSNPHTSNWIYAPFIAKKFFDNLTDDQGRLFNLQIYDGEESDPDNLIYTSKSDDDRHTPAYVVKKRISLMGREWLGIWESTEIYETQERNSESFIILVGGLVFTAILSVLLIIFSISGRETLEKTAKGNGCVLPIFILAVGISGTLYLYNTIVAKEKAYIEGLLRERTQATTTLLSREIDEMVLALKRMGARTLISGKDNTTLWATDSRNYLDDFESLIQISWIDHRYKASLSNHKKSGPLIPDHLLTESPTFISELKTAEKNKTPLIADSGNRRDLVIFDPVQSDGVHAGFVIGVISLPTLINQAFSKESFRNLAIEIRQDNETIYQQESLETINKADNISIKVPLRIGKENYDIIVTPSHEYLAMNSGYLSLSVLISGMIISILMAMTGRYILLAKLRANRLGQAIKAADAANTAKGLFLANISHEIRTPLNGVLATAELLSKSDLNPGQRRYLDIIQNSGELLFSLLNDVLDLSKIDMHKLELDEAPFDIHRSITLSAELFVSSARQKGINLRTSISPDIPEWVMGDYHRFSQILTNLIGNAVKYTDRGLISIIAGKQIHSEKDYIHIEIRDTGIGIPEEHIDALFNRFSQAHTNRKIAGTGLGLAICKSLVEMMGGQIGVESKQGIGSVFWFRIPMRPHQPPQVTAEKNSPAPAGSMDYGLKILLAEDTESNRLIITDMLSYLGHEIETAENGEEAVEMAGQKTYDIILMDCNMPVMDGYEATREIRRQFGKNTPIIAISAHAFTQDVQMCYTAGMDDYIQKPVKLSALKDTLDKWRKNGTSTADIAQQPMEDTPEKPEPPTLDLATIIEWAGTDKAHLDKILSMTLKSALNMHAEISEYVASNDLDGVRSTAHALKSVAAQVGAMKLSALCLKLEREAKDMGAEEIKTAFSEFEKEMAVFRTAIEDTLNKPDYP